MLPLEQARACAESLVETARQSGADAADAVYVGHQSESVQVRLRELEQVDRSESEEVGLRVFVGQCSASVASSDFSGEALAEAIPGARFQSIPGNHMSAVTKPELGSAIAEFLAA